MNTERFENPRRIEYGADALFTNRWSPRALSGETVSKSELLTLFEAARWAPSSYNNQSWRFLYALKGTPAWKTYFDLLIEFNQSWVKNAGALIVILSKKTFDHNGEPSRTHAFDAGAAWENLALQASLKGLVAHGMEGFDYDRARTALKVPDGYEIHAMAAIGRPGKKEDLPKALQEREAPSPRKKVAEFAADGTFPWTGKND